MLKWYGIVGLVIIALVEVNFALKIEPFASWYFPIVWFGYILFVDALIRQLGKKSLMQKPKHFLALIILSAAFWWIFEFINGSIRNWSYANVVEPEWLGNIFGTISFSTVLPAVFETYYLLRAVHIFDHFRLKKPHKITKPELSLMFLLGMFCLIAPIVWPKYFFPLVWLSFFFLLDPINYLEGRPSIIKHLKDRRLTIPLALFAAGIVCGILWEFWNFWAIPKWHYDVPFVGVFKIFEMPMLGYLGYGPFAWELYAMYNFVFGFRQQK
ncbi:MAG: hypothetical protein HZB67_04055 [Candidatus Aenigmarchaeota archaeon]|nr:hypothetical protein [Candidatus Aenigmarchaeota archaeon]